MVPLTCIEAQISILLSSPTLHLLSFSLAFPLHFFVHGSPSSKVLHSSKHICVELLRGLEFWEFGEGVGDALVDVHFDADAVCGC